MNYIIERLQEIVDEVTAAVAASDLSDKADITITNDGRHVATAQSLKAGAIVVYAFPGQEWPAGSTSRLTWTIGVLASGDDLIEAATRIHDLVDVVRASGVVRAKDKAVPMDFELPDQSPVPGYAITHIEEHRS